MLALTELKPGQLVVGMFDVDIDSEGEDNMLWFSVHRLHRDDVGPYWHSDLGLEDTYTSVSVPIPEGVHPYDLPAREWVEVSATGVEDGTSEVLADVPVWAHDGFKEAVRIAVERQMADLQGKPRDWSNE